MSWRSRRRKGCRLADRDDRRVLRGDTGGDLTFLLNLTPLRSASWRTQGELFDFAQDKPFDFAQDKPQGDKRR